MIFAQFVVRLKSLKGADDRLPDFGYGPGVIGVAEASFDNVDPNNVTPIDQININQFAHGIIGQFIETKILVRPPGSPDFPKVEISPVAEARGGIANEDLDTLVRLAKQLDISPAVLFGAIVDLTVDGSIKPETLAEELKWRKER